MERPRRVSARATSAHRVATLPQPTSAEVYRQRVQDAQARYREERAAAAKLLLELLADGGEIYSVQLAKLMGWEGGRGVARAKGILNALEEEDVLVSTLRLPGRGEGGPGRRYYRLKKFEAAAE